MSKIKSVSICVSEQTCFTTCGQAGRSTAGVRRIFLGSVAEEAGMIDTCVAVKPADWRNNNNTDEEGKIPVGRSFFVHVSHNMVQSKHFSSML